jgi:predicted ABC-type ATPase
MGLDSWLLFDNSGDMPHVVAKETDGIVTVVNCQLSTVIDDILFADIRKYVEGL